MNFEEKTFKKPVSVIQIFRHILRYGKEDKPSEKRLGFGRWDAINSQSGHLYDGHLYLPDSITEHPHFDDCNLIIMVDDNSAPLDLNGRDVKTHYCLSLSQPNKFDIFELQAKDDLELYLRYDHFKIGEPAREDFKLCNIRFQHPVEIQINGKLDFALSSRRPRTYLEQYYLFDYWGDFLNAFLMKSPYPNLLKTVPHHRKIINLLKPLW